VYDFGGLEEWLLPKIRSNNQSVSAPIIVDNDSNVDKEAETDNLWHLTIATMYDSEYCDEGVYIPACC
jgi:hypothetical protein